MAVHTHATVMHSALQNTLLLFSKERRRSTFLHRPNLLLLFIIILLSVFGLPTWSSKRKQNSPKCKTDLKILLLLLLLLGLFELLIPNDDHHHVSVSDLLIEQTSNQTSSSSLSATYSSTWSPSASSAALESVEICSTASKGWEAIFESLLGILFREEGFLPIQGGVLDVGAQFGEQACHFAILAPNRQITAMDPSPSQVQKIKDSTFFSKLTNLQVVQAGIGANRSSHVITNGDLHMKGGGGFTGLNVGDTFEVETVDHLFYDQGKLLAFAHFDVEGRELDTLRGAEQTIRANHPVFTTEVRVHRDPTYTKDLLGFIDSLGYDSYVVDEVCGFPHMDFRNLLNIPRSLSAKLHLSDAFTFAMASEIIWRVDSKSIFDTVLPCCALGNACCDVKDTSDPICCAQEIVDPWRRRHPVSRPEATIGWGNSRRITIRRWDELMQRGRLANS